MANLLAEIMISGLRQKQKFLYENALEEGGGGHLHYLNIVEALD